MCSNHQSFHRFVFFPSLPELSRKLELNLSSLPLLFSDPVEGTETTVIDETTKKQKKVLRKIPPKVIKEAGQSSARSERLSTTRARLTSFLSFPSPLTFLFMPQLVYVSSRAFAVESPRSGGPVRRSFSCLPSAVFVRLLSSCHARRARMAPPAVLSLTRTLSSCYFSAGGAGIVIARLPDGSWSAPSSLSPNK